MNSVEWGLINSFLAVAREGSLSAAARVLGVSQPTLTRNIQALETNTKLNLFRRTTQGLELTEAGRSLMESAARMDEAADQFMRQVSGLSEELSGDVRISANEIVGIFLLPPALTALRQKHTGLQIELVINNAPSNLSKREADMAFRMFRPTQPDLVARRLPDLALGFYAHKNYLKQHGEPKSFDEMLKHQIVGLDEGTDFIDGGRMMGVEFKRRDFVFRTDCFLAGINLVRSGAGVGATHVGLASRWPELVRVLEFIPLPPLELWLVCHKDVQYNKQIATVMKFMGEWFHEDPYRFAII